MDLVAGLAHFYVAWDGENLPHISWVVLAGVKTSLPGIRVSAGDAELRAVYTPPPYRRRGLFRVC